MSARRVITRLLPLPSSDGLPASCPGPRYLWVDGYYDAYDAWYSGYWALPPYEEPNGWRLDITGDASTPDTRGRAPLRGVQSGVGPGSCCKIRRTRRRHSIRNQPQ